MGVRIEDKLKKEYWRRRIHPDAKRRRRIPYASTYYVEPNLPSDSGDYLLLTQEDLMREVEPSAHVINSDIMSTRPVYDVREVEIKDENGNVIDTQSEWYIREFDEVETVRFGWQKRIDLSKAAYVGGGNVWICHEDMNHENGELLSSWKDIIGLNMAWQEVVKSCFLTGDGAVYLYRTGNTLTYEVFSYLKGDTLFPDYDDERRPILYRLYTLRGRKAVDIYACDYIETWVQDGTADKSDKEQEKMRNWWQRFGGWFAKGLDWNSTKLSDDGWRRLVHKDTQISKDLNQVVYFRIDDCPHGAAQMEIEALERASSFVAEGVKSTSQPILFVKAADIENLPEQDSHGKTIGVKGTMDELRAADAKYLGVPDVSNIATIDLANKKESILRTTLSTEITPDIFKSGADSSAAMSLLFTDEVIWGKNMMVQLYPQLRYLVEVFKALVDKVEEKGGVIARMRTSCGVDFYLPRNEAERLKMELDQVYSKTKSRKAAMSDIGNSHPEDYKQIMEEWREELDLKSRVPAVAKAQVEEQYGESVEKIEVEEVEEENNPEKPKIDNNAKGKTLLE